MKQLQRKHTQRNSRKRAWCLFIAWVVFCSAQAVTLAEQATPVETVPPNYCPRCLGTHGTWYVDYPFWGRIEYGSVMTKSVRNLVWGSLGLVLRNSPGEGAMPVTYKISDKVSFSYTVSDSGSDSATIKSELRIPKAGSIGGSYTNTSTWKESISGSSERTIEMTRICPPGKAIWDRAHYYSRVDTGERFRYECGMAAKYWCPTCKDYTRTGYSFTDIYDRKIATFTYPSGEAGVSTFTGSYDTDPLSPSHYTSPSASHEDANFPVRFTAGKNWKNWWW